jgi:WD40-like Beta Propeller Repeat
MDVRLSRPQLRSVSVPIARQRPKKKDTLLIARSTSIVAALLLGLATAIALTPNVSASSTRILTRLGSQRMVAIPPAGGAPQTLFRASQGFITSIAASPDGRHIAVAVHSLQKRGDDHRAFLDRIWIMSADGTDARVVRTFRASRGSDQPQVDSIAVSPNGSHILVGKTVREHAGIAPIVMRADGSDSQAILLHGYRFGSGPGYNYGNLEFTPDSRRIIGQFYSVGSSMPRMRGIGTVKISGGPIHFLRFGPVGSRRGSGFGPTISDDGRFIAFVVGRKRSGRIMVMRRDGTHLHALPQTTMPGWRISNPDFSPSGDSLAFAGELGRPIRRIGVDPAAIFTIRRSGSNLRRIQREKLAHWYARNPAWIR